MSPEFQTTLGGNKIADTFQDVAYFSEVYMRHEGTNGGYLHSHDTNYKTGSNQQQVTVYPFHDKNSLFIIQPRLDTIKVEESVVVDGNTTIKMVDKLTVRKVEGFQAIKDGSMVRLLHKVTNKYLHSHDKRAPVTDSEHHNEVSGYATGVYPGGDSNDHWIVEVEGIIRHAPYDLNRRGRSACDYEQVQAEACEHQLQIVLAQCKATGMGVRAAGSNVCEEWKTKADTVFLFA